MFSVVINCRKEYDAIAAKQLADCFQLQAGKWMTHRQRIAGDMSVTDIAQDQQAHGMTMIKII